MKCCFDSKDIMDKSVQTCLEMVHRQDRARYLTTLYAPSAARPGLWALHAFDLELARISETVSEPMIGDIKLAWWQEAVDDVYAGISRKHDVAQALSLLVTAVPQNLLVTMIEGRSTDLDQGYLTDFAALENYARQTGGAQQQAVMHILDVRDDRLHQKACDIGTAWTLTGIVRAISFHASRQRVYLPEQELAALGVNRESLFQRAIGPEIIPLITRMIQRAQELLGSHSAVSPLALPGLLLGTLVRDHCARISKAGYDVTRLTPDAGDVVRQLKLAWASLRRQY
jgi:phytoene synthase